MLLLNNIWTVLIKVDIKVVSAVDGGRNSKNRLIHDIVQQYNLERKYGLNQKGIAKSILTN